VPRGFRFPRISLAQFAKRFLDGELCGFGHCQSSYWVEQVAAYLLHRMPLRRCMVPPGWWAALTQIKPEERSCRTSARCRYRGSDRLQHASHCGEQAFAECVPRKNMARRPGRLAALLTSATNSQPKHWLGGGCATAKKIRPEAYFQVVPGF
jgi:hypothetical protein